MSQQLTANLCKPDKKQQGIFFTPCDTIRANIKLLEPYMTNMSILEPSCGSCEYIFKLQALNSLNNIDQYNITGIELNTTIFKSIQQYSSSRKTTNTLLTINLQEKFDLIIEITFLCYENRC